MDKIVTQVLKIHTVRSIGLFLFMTCISAFHATASQNNFCQDKSDELSCGNLGQFQNASGLNSLDVLFQTGGVMKQHLSLKNSSDQYKGSDVNYGIEDNANRDQFDGSRGDIEEQEVKHRVYALRAAFNRLGDFARAPTQMES